MIWLNPWAWIGLIAVGVPVLIHLLDRHSARVQRFPTLRFLDAPRVLPRRRTRLSDVSLLAVRVGILAAAVMALAQPLVLTPGRSVAANSRLARAIVLDTSASMLRTTASGQRAVDTARVAAQQLTRETQTSVILETVSPASVLAGAVVWLDTQPARRELVIVSDFQAGSLDSADLNIIPQRVGVRLMRIGPLLTDTTIESVTRHGDVESVARITLAPEHTSVTWTARPTALSNSGIVLLAGAAEQNAAEAARTAASALGLPLTADTTIRIAIVFPGYEQRTALIGAVQAVDEPWMGDVVARLQRDSLLMTASTNAELRENVAFDSARFAVIAQTNSGQPALFAAKGPVGDRDGLVLFSQADAGTLASAALIAATSRAHSAIPVAELEPSSLPPELLERLQRPPSSDAAPDSSGDASDGRWLWLIALLLLGVETAMRRTQRQPVAETREVPHERVA